MRRIPKGTHAVLSSLKRVRCSRLRIPDTGSAEWKSGHSGWPVGYAISSTLRETEKERDEEKNEGGYNNRYECDDTGP